MIWALIPACLIMTASAFLIGARYGSNKAKQMIDELRIKIQDDAQKMKRTKETLRTSHGKHSISSIEELNSMFKSMDDVFKSMDDMFKAASFNYTITTKTGIHTKKCKACGQRNRFEYSKLDKAVCARCGFPIAQKLN